MAVVTISREYGSAGSAVARKAAVLLGYHLVDKAAIGRILAGYGLIDFEKTYETESNIWSAFDTRQRTIVSMLERIAFAVARHGHSIILGRGFYVVLSKIPGILNVRIRAPFEWRVSSLMEERGIGRAEAETELREGDKIRSSFVSSVYGLRWDSMDPFDLVVNTSKIGPDRAASWIAEAVREFPDANGKPSSPAPQLGKPDPVLDEAIAAELKCDKKA